MIQVRENELDKLKEQFQALSDQILSVLDVMELENVRAHGYLFFKETRASVQVPKTPEDKAALFAFLTEKGMFDEMATIHSATLNALYRSLSEEALKEGVLDFRLPGVGEPKSYTTLKLRKTN